MECYFQVIGLLTWNIKSRTKDSTYAFGTFSDKFVIIPTASSHPQPSQPNFVPNLMYNLFQTKKGKVLIMLYQ